MRATIMVINATFNNASSHILHKLYQYAPLRKAVMDTCAIQLTVNHTLALEYTLLNTLTCMVDFTCLKLDQNILNSSDTLGTSVQ